MAKTAKLQRRDRRWRHTQGLVPPPAAPADEGKVATAQADGTVLWETPAAASGVPVGTVVAWAAIPSENPVPTGWLECNGAAVSRVTYAALYNVALILGEVQAPFGNGDGSTTFNVPDYRGRTLIGPGQGTGLTNRAHGATGGAETHTLVVGETPLRSHTHVIRTYISTGGSTTGVVRTSTGSSETSTVQTNQSDITVCDPHNNMQPFSAARWIIYAGTPVS